MASFRRTTAALAVLLLTAAVPALATDYYVRPDGSDANSGTSNSAGGAWKSVGKCASTLNPGDRCLIQPGTYSEVNISPARGGSLKANNADFDGDGSASRCSCTRGSTSITCDETVSGIAAGDFVQCDGGYGFSWTEVQSASGTTITLKEGYRGATSSSDTIDSARFVQYLGQGASAEDVLITQWRGQPKANLWTLESGCVYSYSKSDAGLAGTPWANPTSFHDDVPRASWDTYAAPAAGRDPYYYVKPNDCPCSRSTVVASVEEVPRSWGEDGSKVYLHTQDCTDPDTRALQAGNRAEYTTIFTGSKDYMIVANFTAEVPIRAEQYTYWNSYSFKLGASNARYSNLNGWTGRVHFMAPDDSVDTLYEHIDALGGAAGMAGTHSGLRFYDMELRFSRPSVWSMDSCSGKSAEDRVIFDRIYVHRAGSFLWDLSGSCSNDGYWNCSTHTWERPWRGVHGIDIGSISSSAPVDHILIQNSIVEVTGDGVRFTGAGSDKIIRNNTFGASHDPESALEVIWLGTSGASWGAQVYNNVFFCDKSSCAGGIKYSGTRNITADHNAYLYPYTSYSGSPRVWEESDTLEVVRSSYGQEAHGFVVCSSGCSGSQGRYFNDGNGSHRFVDPRVDDGTPSNYTPQSTSRLVNAGMNGQCPTEDFYGNPRNDGACDIGAVEARGGTPDTTPPEDVENNRRTDTQ